MDESSVGRGFRRDKECGFCQAVRASEDTFACMAHKRPAASPVDNQVIELDGRRHR